MLIVRARALRAVLAGAAILLASCASTTRLALADPAPARADIEVLLAGRGPVPVTVETGSRPGEYGCAVAFEVYRPAAARTDTLVVLGHGFGSSLSWMRGWAERWASFGVPTAILGFCNSTPFNGRHDRNAKDMVALARALHDGPVLYAGFSAGGLAAFLATTADPRATAYLGLDAVDSGRLALAAKGGFAVPALFVLGEPGACNAKGNMLPAIPSRPTARVLRVKHALHGHFQDPYDPRVETVCGKVVPGEAATAIIDDIRSLATAWVLAATGAMPGAAALVDAAASGAGDWTGRVEVP